MVAYFNQKWNTFQKLFNYFSPLFLVWSVDPTIVLKKNNKKKILTSKMMLRKPQIHSFFLTALTAQTAPTKEFMFQNVAYWPTVYRTGTKTTFCEFLFFFFYYFQKGTEGSKGPFCAEVHTLINCIVKNWTDLELHAIWKIAHLPAQSLWSFWVPK